MNVVEFIVVGLATGQKALLTLCQTLVHATTTIRATTAGVGQLHGSGSPGGLVLEFRTILLGIRRPSALPRYSHR